MRRSRLTRHLPNVEQISFATAELTHWQILPSRQRYLNALLRRLNTSSRITNNNLNSSSRHWTSLAHVPKNVPWRGFHRVSQLSRWEDLAKLGQRNIQQLTNSKLKKSSVPHDLAKSILGGDDPAALSDNQSASMRLAQAIQGGDSCEDMWAIFELLQKDEYSEVLSLDDAELLRDEVLKAALTSNSWLNVLVDTAHRLLVKREFYWPDLYMKIMHHMLENGRHDDSIRWHLRLAPKFLPSVDVFGALLSSFVLVKSPRMQSNLTALYFLNLEKELYDYIIPVIFAAGRSKLARAWRKKLLIFGDLPNSNKCTPFLRFLVQYYPSITLTEEERALAEVTQSMIRDSPSQWSHDDNSSKGQYSDGLVAKWFASPWTSIDFAIHFAQRLGLRMIGPRSLQSLALRESGAKMVALRLARIEKLGITISSTNYCKALTVFAKNEEDSLLADLLACDIHPDEFDDAEMRQMLMASSVRNGDWRRQRLLQGIEWALASDASSCRLNALLRLELATHKLGRARQVLDRMEALKVNMNQQNASQFLVAAFMWIGKHPTNGKRRHGKSRTNYQSLLDGAIGIVRRVALHNVAIPLRYWKLLLYNLGRLGRLDELQQLSEEIVQLYSPPSGGLVPISSEDLPQSLLKGRRTTDVLTYLSRLSVHETDADKELRQDIDSPSSPTVSNPDNSETDGSYYQWSEAARNATARSNPHWTALDDSAGEINPSIEACDDEACSLSCIPADLPMGHRQHPVQQIFDTSLQRSIVRWGFDQKLSKSPASPSLKGLTETGIAAYDIASGVRLLARLRDFGVLIDLQVLRVAISSRIALGQVPGRERDRSRDRHELSPERLKPLFDEAWGSEIFSTQLELLQEVEKQRPKLWARYPGLFGQSFDKQEDFSTEQAF